MRAIAGPCLNDNFLLQVPVGRIVDFDTNFDRFYRPTHGSLYTMAVTDALQVLLRLILVQCSVDFL